MKQFYTLKVLLATSVLSIFAANVNAQCNRSVSYWGEMLPNAGCGTFADYGSYGPGMYFRMPVLNGGSYTISTCTAPFDTQLTGYEATATLAADRIFYNDDFGPVCPTSRASITHVPDFTDYMRVQVSQFNCLYGGASSITVSVRQNNNLSITSSAADMCVGDIRALTATPTAIAGPLLAGSGNGGTFSGTGIVSSTFTAPTPAGASQVYTITYTFGYCSTTQNITVYNTPDAALAGDDQLALCDTFATMAANDPIIGTGMWEILTGPGVITDPADPLTTVTGLEIGTTTELRWYISNGPCAVTADTVLVGVETNDPVPTVAALADVTAECEATPVAPTADDDCAGTITGVPDVAFPINMQGTTTVTWTYDDENGNVITQTQDVVIDDITDPVPDLAALADITAECEVAFLTLPTATDNCGGTVTVSHDATLPITDPGTTIVTWTYDDGNGNTATQTQNVIIEDITAPVADVEVLEALEGDCTFSPTAPTAEDNCSGALEGVSDLTFPITNAGTYTITWTYTDETGNTSMQTQDVTITTVDVGVTVDAATITADYVGAISYQWLDCDDDFAPIDGETGISFTPTDVTGNYAVEITDICVDTSICTLIDYTGIDKIVSTIEVSIYPNPSDGMFTVELVGLSNEILELRIVDVQGRIVIKELFQGVNGNYIKKIDISEHESGIYLINLIGERGLLMSKQIVKD